MIIATLRPLMPCLLVAIATCVAAETPCDFKGVSVGDRATPASLMAAFGIKDYKINPQRWPIEKKLQVAEKYGLSAATEIEDSEIGAACDGDSCRIPFGIGVGNNNTPVSVFVSLREGRVTEIDVMFNESNWSEISPILNKKYGANWRVERDQEFLITNIETKKSVSVERLTLTHRANGRNKKTGDSCMLWAVNFDLIFQHHDPLGPYHSVFVIKLVSGNF